MERARPSRAEVLASVIEHDILDSRPTAGDRLGLRTELIEQYDTTPAVMNEALQILRERGLIVVKRGATGGIFVNDVPPQLRIGVVDIWFSGVADARELFEARRTLEGLMSEMAFHRATPEDVAAMSWAFDELQALRTDPADFFSAILRFHVAISRAARIPYVSDLYASISSLLANSIVKARFIDDSMSTVESSIRAHGRILEAIRTHNMELLQRACRVHNELQLRETHQNASP